MGWGMVPYYVTGFVEKQMKDFNNWQVPTMRAVISGVVLGAVLCMMPADVSAQDTVRITLPQAIDLATARNIDVLRAENALRSAQTRIESARGALQPNLTVSAGPGVRYQLGRSNELLGETSNNASGSFSVGLSSGYTLYNGNADRATLNQAEQLARASDISINRTAQSTVYGVITSFYQIATARELIATARENLLAERNQLDRVRAFTEAGTRPISDLYAQDATVASAEFRLLDAERSLDVAKLGLVQTLRLDPLGAYEFPEPSPAEFSGVGSDGESALVEQALSRRPEIAAQQARLDAAVQSIRIAEASDAPTISVSGSLGSSYSTTDTRDGFAGQIFSQNPNAGLGLSLSLPLFDRNRTAVAEAQARIEYENEILTMASLRQQTAVEVRQVLLDLNTAQAQLGVAQRQLASARQGLDVEQTRYDAGVSTLTELSQARARYVDAQGQVVQASNTLELRRHGVLFVLGVLDAPRATPQPPTEQEVRRP